MIISGLLRLCLEMAEMEMYDGVSRLVDRLIDLLKFIPFGQSSKLFSIDVRLPPSQQASLGS